MQIWLARDLLMTDTPCCSGSLPDPEEKAETD